MSLDQHPKRKRTTDFWRACRFLGPYRRLVTTSVICAFLAAAIMTSGISALFPILQILLRGETVSTWIDRQIVEKRLGVDLAEDAEVVRIIKLQPDGTAAREGLQKNQIIRGAGRGSVPPGDTPPRQILATLAEGETLLGVGISLGGMDQRRLPSWQPPWYMRLGRSVAQRVPAHPVWALVTIFLAVAALALCGNFVRFFQEYYSEKSAIGAVNDIRQKLYDHVLHIPLAFFGLKGTSDVTSRLVQDCQGLQEGFKVVLGQGVLEPLRATLALTFAMVIDWRLTMFIIVCGPAMGLVIRKFGKKMRRANRAALQTNARMLGQIEGSLSGIRVVKAANAERFERRRYTKIMSNLRREQLKMARYEALSTPVIETMGMWVAGAVLIFAAYLIFVQQSLSDSKFIVIMACLITIGESLRRVSKLNNVVQRSSAAAARIFETLDVPIERPRRVLPLPPGEGRGEGVLDGRLINLPLIQREVRFEDVTFSYPNASAPAVADVDLVVPKGKSVAVVGRNGSGKTTLMALLPRFYDPQRGRLLIDGTDIRRVTLPSLRKQISIVTQDSVIFPGTIAENIAYGLPLATREQVESAARRAFCHDFIAEKSQGYDTPLDGLGGQLSGGQKQRLNIARAILRQAPILILDEATSQVDAESEHLIQQAIEGLMHERTTFVIAHRFSTITSADWIVVMDRGRIVGQGQHAELLKTCETYQQLYERQMVTATAE